MSANDSGIENSNDSNDFTLTFPAGYVTDTFNDFTSRAIIDISTSSQQAQINQFCRESSGKVKVSKPWTKQSLRLATLPYFRARLNERKLRVAASISNIELLTLYLENGANPNGCDELQRSALHLAASRGFSDIVTQLLKFGANPNQKDLLGNTPLHLAVCSASSINFNTTVRVLLNHGASVRCFDKMGRNPLDLANSKLSLLRRRCDYPESDKMLRDMSMLIAFLLFHYHREEKDDFEINSLELRLQNLSTKEVENEADKLLAKVELLKLQN